MLYILTIIAKHEKHRAEIINEGGFSVLLETLSMYGGNKILCKASFTLLRRLLVKNSGILDEDISQLISVLGEGISKNHWETFEKDVIEILYIISFDYLETLQKNIGRDLLKLVYEKYRERRQRTLFPSLCILGNLI